MSPIKLAGVVLEDIILKDKNFQLALKEHFAQNPSEKEQSAFVTALTGCALRHLFLFEELLKEIEGDFDDLDRMIIFAAFSNHFFIKRLSDDEMLADLKEILNDKYSQSLENFLRKDVALMDLIGDKYSRDSLEFTELRFNTPKWLIRMWQKQYGKSLTYKILKKNGRAKLQTCRVNTLKTNEEKVLSENEGSYLTSSVKDVLIYKDKAPIRRNRAFKKFDIFLEKAPLKVALDKAYDDSLNNIALYSATDDSLIRELYVRLKDNHNLSLVFDSFEAREDALKLVKHYHADNVKCFELNENNLPSELSNELDLAIIYPKNSSFENIRIYPDYLYHFKRDAIDEYIQKQKAMLFDFANRIKNDGKILYLVDTIDKKEGHSVIMDFLNQHHDFLLEEENQYFPFDELDTALYYAVLKKVGEAKID